MTCSICKGKYHFVKGGVIHRCKCLDEKNLAEYLGKFFSANPLKAPNPLKDLNYKKDIVFMQGNIPSFKDVFSDYLRNLRDMPIYGVVDSYKLVEVFLDQHFDIPTVREYVKPELLVILLGVTTVPNKMVPQLVEQVISMRELDGRLTWYFSTKSTGEILNLYGNPIYNRVMNSSHVNLWNLCS